VGVALVVCCSVSVALDGDHSLRRRHRDTQTPLEGSVASPAPSDGFTQTVMERANNPNSQSLDRVWDTEDSEGGSTIVLSNRNNMEAFQKKPKNVKFYGDYIAAVKKEQEKETHMLQAAKKALADKKRRFAIAQAEAKAKADEEDVKADVAAAIKASHLHRKPFTIQQGKLIAEHGKIEASDHITYEFWIKPLKTSKNWTSILQKGDDQGDRAPAVFFYPGSFKLQVKSATATNWNDGPLKDAKVHLEAKKWSHVAFTHRLGEFKLYVNGQVVAKNTHIDAPKNNLASLYACSPNYPCAHAEIAEIRYYPRVLTEDEIIASTQEKIDFSKHHDDEEKEKEEKEEGGKKKKKKEPHHGHHKHNSTSAAAEESADSETSVSQPTL